MTDKVKIENNWQLQRWLETQEVRVSQSIASRAALRTLPAAMAVVGQTLKNIDGDRLLLVCARATLTSGVASTCAALDVERVTTAALSAADSAAYFADDPSFSNAFVARCAAHSAISASSNFPSPAHYARFAVHSVQTSASPTAAAFDATVFQTATQWELFDAVLWPQEHAVQEFIEQWSVFDQRQDPKGIWTFWKQWYRGMMEGVPLDWGLQLRVALIEDEIWKSGPEAVAREIERIQVKHELELEIAALRGQLAEAKQLSALPNRLHNHPPEAVDDTIFAFRTDVTLVWDQLTELEEEVRKPQPSPSRLLKIAKWLSDKATAMALYCGSLADDWVRAGGKAFAITAGTAGGAKAVTSIPGIMNSVSHFAEKLANLLGG